MIKVRNTETDLKKHVAYIKSVQHFTIISNTKFEKVKDNELSTKCGQVMGML